MKAVIKSRGFLKTMVLAGLASALTWVVMSVPSIGVPEKKDAPMANLGLKEFTQSEITYDGVMHELYWHYEFANQMMRVGMIEDAKAHFKVLSFYVNLLPMLQRDGKFFKTPDSKANFDKYATGLLESLDKVYRNLNATNTKELGAQMEKDISAMCHHCHDVLKEPVREITPYGQTIVLGQGNKKTPAQPSKARTR